MTLVTFNIEKGKETKLLAFPLKPLPYHCGTGKFTACTQNRESNATAFSARVQRLLVCGRG